MWPAFSPVRNVVVSNRMSGIARTMNELFGIFRCFRVASIPNSISSCTQTLPLSLKQITFIAKYDTSTFLTAS